MGFEVDNPEAEIERLKSQGVPVLMEVREGALCRFGMIADPDGNRILIHKRKAT